MRLPRFRVRTLMIVVGVVALLIWGAMLASRSYDYYRREGIRSPGAADGANRLEEPSARVEAISFGVRPVLRAVGAKYRQAMWRPWMPVAPDPHAPGYDQWLEQERRAKGVAAILPHPEAEFHLPQSR